MKMLSDIEICLDDRKRILNERFVWNDEAINGIRTLSQRLVDAEQLVVTEYYSRKAELESRIQQKDKFLTDFNINPVINLMIMVPDKEDEGEWEDPEDGIYSILNGFIRGDSLCASSIAGINLWEEDRKEVLNWNRMLGDASEHFREDFIHYGLHFLYDHSPLAWEDILKIRSVWAEVSVDYQRCCD